MVDIPGVVQSIRQQRMKMVQTVVCNVFIVPLIGNYSNWVHHTTH